MIETGLENVTLNNPIYIIEWEFVEILKEICSMTLMQFAYICLDMIAMMMTAVNGLGEWETFDREIRSVQSSEELNYGE